MKNVKLLHYQHMGVGVILSRALNQMGAYSRVLSTAPHPFGFKEDFLLPRQWYVRLAFGRLLWSRYYGYDLLHSHENLPLPRHVLDHWKGRMVQHYHDPKTKASLYGDVPSLVSLPTLLDVIPNSTWIPLPVETDVFNPKEEELDEPVRVGFSDQTTDPTKAQYIPKAEIEEAVERSKGKAVAVPLRNIVHHMDMPTYYNGIDVWVDRFGLEFYGFAACEAAAMGKPVICEVDERARAHVQNCPFLITMREKVPGSIQMLVEDEALRKSLGSKAREYALQVHDYMKVAKLCLNVYEEVLG